MKKRIIFLLLGLAIARFGFAQSFAINATGDTAHKSAIFDVKSNTKGILIPRMSQSERDAISSPVTSLLIYQNNNDSGYYYFDGSIWLKLSGYPSGAGVCRSVIPQPLYPDIDGAISIGSNSNITAFLGKVQIPLKITANQISVYVGAIPIPGKIKIGLYSDDGQTKIFETISDTITTGGLNTINLNSATLINQGFYYIVVLPLGTASLGLSTYYISDIPSPFLHPTGKDILSGELTVSPNTLPPSFNPVSDIIFSEGRILIFRLDN